MNQTDVMLRQSALQECDRWTRDGRPRRGPEVFDRDALPSLGWVRIHDVGEEGIKFTSEDGREGYSNLSA